MLGEVCIAVLVKRHFMSKCERWRLNEEETNVTEEASPVSPHHCPLSDQRVQTRQSSGLESNCTQPRRLGIRLMHPRVGAAGKTPCQSTLVITVARMVATRCVQDPNWSV
jgi:hypothetical protein